jgi:lipopolysaccharide export system permease protein
VRIKKLSLLVLKEFAGPFVVTFFIALFVLIMQFLWKYIDDMVGKGLEWTIIAKLIFYTSFTLVPLALPLAILVSSIMTYGNLAEHLEITAAKASGISLTKMFRPLLITAAFISVIAFLFSNYVLPVANLKSGVLLYDVRQQRPALDIREGVFYSGIDGYSIRIGKKDKNSDKLYDIMIYDHTQGLGNNKVILAERGEMKMTDDKQFMILTLYDGKSYEEGVKFVNGVNTRPFTQASFSEQQIRFDLSVFNLKRTPEEWYKDSWQMLNFRQLTRAIDSLKLNYNNRAKELAITSATYLSFMSDSANLLKASTSETVPAKNPLLLMKERNADRIYENALSLARNSKIFVSNNKDEMEARQRTITRYTIEWHRKFTLSIACIILFLIGAPFGAIVKKGGLGLPLVVSILFFLLFHILSITGEKFAKENVLDPATGMWIAPLALLPVGLILMYKATHDSVIFDLDAYRNYLKKIFKSPSA